MENDDDQYNNKMEKMTPVKDLQNENDDNIIELETTSDVQSQAVIVEEEEPVCLSFKILMNSLSTCNIHVSTCKIHVSTCNIHVYHFSQHNLVAGLY